LEGKPAIEHIQANESPKSILIGKAVHAASNVLLKWAEKKMKKEAPRKGHKQEEEKKKEALRKRHKKKEENKKEALRKRHKKIKRH
jgi:hypothetical protein